MILVASTVGKSPTVDATGKVTFDEFANAKDILLAILPLATTSLGYWYGNQGANDAKEAAAQAHAQAADAVAETSKVKDQLTAVVDQSAPGTLAEAKQNHKDAFAPNMDTLPPNFVPPHLP